MASQPLPKTNLLGNYPKKSMNAYIFEMNEKSQEDQQRLTEKLQDAERQKEELQGRLDALQNDIAGWESKCRDLEQKAAHFNDDLVAKESELFAAKQKSVELLETIDRQKAELAQAHDRLAEKDAEIEQLMAENERLALRPEVAPAPVAPPEPPPQTERENRDLEAKRRELDEKRRELDEKRREVEVAAQQISRIFASAQADAEALLENARRQAGSITDNAQQKARAMLEQAQTAADQAVGGVFEKFERFRAEFTHAQKIVEGAVQSINTGMASMQSAVAGVKTDAPSAALYTPPIVADLTPRPADTRSPLTSEILNQYGINLERKEFFR